MASMVIRNIPDDVFERFKARAKADGKSAEELGREAILEKARRGRDDILAEIDAIRARSRSVTGFDVVLEIRGDRDGNHTSDPAGPLPPKLDDVR